MTYRVPWAIAAWTFAAGVMLVLGGFAAAFSMVGAVVVLIGLGCMLAGALALVRLPVWLASGAGAVMAALLLVELAITGP